MGDVFRLGGEPVKDGVVGVRAAHWDTFGPYLVRKFSSCDRSSTPVPMIGKLQGALGLPGNLPIDFDLAHWANGRRSPASVGG